MRIIYKLWQWLRDSDNRGALMIIAAIITAVWTLYSHYNPPQTIPMNDRGISLSQKEDNSMSQGSAKIVTAPSVLKTPSKKVGAPQKDLLLPNREREHIDELARHTHVLEKKQQMGKPHFDITGCTDEEISTIKTRLDELSVKAATISIVKSERDNSRDVYIQVTYQDNTMFTDSFNTPLDNLASLIISEISDNRR